MNGKVSRRDFMRQCVFYLSGISALSERGVCIEEQRRQSFPITRMFIESLACLEQLRHQHKVKAVDISSDIATSTKMQV